MFKKRLLVPMDDCILGYTAFSKEVLLYFDASADKVTADTITTHDLDITKDGKQE